MEIGNSVLQEDAMRQFLQYPKKTILPDFQKIVDNNAMEAKVDKFQHSHPYFVVLFLEKALICPICRNFQVVVHQVERMQLEAVVPHEDSSHAART